MGLWWIDSVLLKAYFWDMAGRASTTSMKKTSAEGQAMNEAFKRATKRAMTEAFKVRKTIMIQKDGWLVMVNKAGKVVKRVKKLPALELPAA